MDEKLNLYDAIKITKSHFIHWKALGRESKVDFTRVTKSNIDNDDQLEAVLNKWIESVPITCNWSSLNALQASRCGKQCEAFFESQKIMMTTI